MKPGETIWAGQLTGDFVLPENKNKKLVFIAGGIGITPFRSMVKYLLDTNEKRDIVLLHVCSSSDEFVYDNLLKDAAKIGVKSLHIDTKAEGHMTEDKIKNIILDYKNREYFVSGANAMVHSSKDMLGHMGISQKNIVTDYFPGF